MNDSNMLYQSIADEPLVLIDVYNDWVIADPNIEADGSLHFYLPAEDKSIDATQYEVHNHSEGAIFYKVETLSVLKVYPLTVENFELAFPQENRLFHNDEALLDYIQKKLRNPYTVKTLSSLYAVSFDPDIDPEDDTQEALELLRINTTGEISYREKGRWAPSDLTTKSPTIVNTRLMPIDDDDKKNMESLWDSLENTELPLTQDKVRIFSTISSL